MWEWAKSNSELWKIWWVAFSSREWDNSCRGRLLRCRVSGCEGARRPQRVWLLWRGSCHGSTGIDWSSAHALYEAFYVQQQPAVPQERCHLSVALWNFWCVLPFPGAWRKFLSLILWTQAWSDWRKRCWRCLGWQSKKACDLCGACILARVFRGKMEGENHQWGKRECKWQFASAFFSGLYICCLWSMRRDHRFAFFQLK